MTETTDDATQVRELVLRWARAVHAGDLDAVLADHAEDVVMFDVPPPHDGVRGIEAYATTWPPFFHWQAAGAVFEVVRLDVETGGDVGFAHALLRCGTPDELAAVPDRRLRLTLGLRRVEGRWTVAHEHHSFAALTPDASEVREVLDGWSRAALARDLEASTAHLDPAVVDFPDVGPMTADHDAVREECRRGLEADGDVVLSFPDLDVVGDGDLAVSWGIDRAVVGGATHDTRATRVWRRGPHGWRAVHQHRSRPLG